MHDLLEPRQSPADESRRLLLLLVLASLVVAAVIVAVITVGIGAPLAVGLFVALFFLCLDGLAIAIVWYSMQRR